MRPPINTLFIGKNHRHLLKVESTNAYMRQTLDSSSISIPEGLLVTTDEQFSGKGQGAKSWLSEPKQNLTLSILLRPVFLPPRYVFYLNKAVALAVHDTLATEMHGIAIKWPNDLYHHNNKLGGILIENVIDSTSIRQSIIGIGINVNQTAFDTSIPNATSISLVTGRETDLSALLEKLCGQLEKYYLQLRASQFTAIDALYHHYLFGHQAEHEFLLNNEKITATVNGVNPEGKLILSTPDSKLTLAVGEVTWILP